VGAVKHTVAPYCGDGRQQRLGLAFSSSTVLAPIDSGNSSSPPSPKVKASGGLPMNTSSGLARSTCGGQQAQAAITSRWKCIVPLGTPVVPEVKAIRQVSSAAVSTLSKAAGLDAPRLQRFRGRPPLKCSTGACSVGHCGCALAALRPGARRTARG
jgi:hypothetical protein